MTIGERIKNAREKRGMTQDEVAKLCNTTKQTIFKYENEIVTNIPYDKIVLLSRALNVSPSYLFGWDEEKDSPSKQTLTEGEKLVLEMFRKIPPDQQKVYLEMGRVFVDSQGKD